MLDGFAIVYVDGYQFDEKANKYIRSGKGKEFDKFSGICNRVVERDENGVEMEGKERRLFGGWYGEGESDCSICVGELKRVEKEKRIEQQKRKKEKERCWNEKVIACPGLNLSYPRGIEIIVIPDNSRNENNRVISKILNLSEFKQLKKIKIGKNCFQYVREFVLDGLEKLKSVKIGENCFKISDKERDDGVCRIANCPNLTQLEIGYYSFKYFNKFELSNVNSLQSIQFGGGCFRYAENCILKGE